MPHAAFYVVQPLQRWHFRTPSLSFNAARGFLCGATSSIDALIILYGFFNAARGFLCGETFGADG